MVAIVLALVLTALSGLHLAWAFGVTWPEKSEAALVRRVAGFPGADRMPPPLASGAVAAILLFGAHIALAVSGLVAVLAPTWVYTLAIWGMAVVFAARGLASYTNGWRKLTPVEPFATLDRRFYGPLCLLLAVLTTLVAVS